jgi:hypothetical protein
MILLYDTMHYGEYINIICMILLYDTLHYDQPKQSSPPNKFCTDMHQNRDQQIWFLKELERTKAKLNTPSIPDYRAIAYF